MTPRLLLLLLLAVAGLAMLPEMRTPDPSAQVEASPTSSSFTDGFLEQLGLVRVAADALVELGERRDRNLLVVSQRQAAMNAALNSTDAWLAQQVPHQDNAAVAAYRTGANLIRQAMADAQAAFLRFDWDGIAAANDTLKQGAEAIAEAEARLRS